jgi:competence protein ComEA
VTAKAIIQYRQENGPFNEIEAIQAVSGIGPVTFDKIREFITVGGAPED